MPSHTHTRAYTMADEESTPFGGGAPRPQRQAKVTPRNFCEGEGNPLAILNYVNAAGAVLNVIMISVVLPWRTTPISNWWLGVMCYGWAQYVINVVWFGLGREAGVDVDGTGRAKRNRYMWFWLASTAFPIFASLQFGMIRGLINEARSETLDLFNSGQCIGDATLPCITFVASCLISCAMFGMQLALSVVAFLSAIYAT